MLRRISPRYASVQNGRDVLEPIRVLLLEMPQLLRDILEDEFHRRSDCELVRDGRGALRLMTERVVAPDVVIIGLTAREDEALVPAVFARWPGAHVMTVMPTGNDVVVYELTPKQEELASMSPAGIVDTLRNAVRRSRGLWQG
jgi:hypothetical protein